MNIVIVSDYGVLNGAATKVALMSARGLAELGHNVHYVHAVGERSPILDHPGIRVHNLAMGSVWDVGNPLKAAARGVWNGPAGAALIRILSQLGTRDTVVHIHQFNRAMSPSVLAAAARSGVPWAVTLHDYFILCPNGIYFDHGKGQACTETPMSLGCMLNTCDDRGVKNKVVRLARQAATSRALASRAKPLTIVSPSAFAWDKAQPFLPADTRHYVVPNVVDVAQAPRADVTANRRVCFMGRLSRDKGVTILAEAGRRAGVEIAFLGHGKAEEELRRQYPEVSFHEWTTRAEVIDHIDRSRGIFFASLWYEPFGMSAMEAVARGVPLIGSRESALGGAIVHGETGFLMEPGNLDQLTAILMALKDDATADRIGAAAWERYWRNPFTPRHHAESIAAVYRSMLEDGDEPVPAIAAE